MIIQRLHTYIEKLDIKTTTILIHINFLNQKQTIEPKTTKIPEEEVLQQMQDRVAKAETQSASNKAIFRSKK